jgi:hypothetical protein
LTTHETKRSTKSQRRQLAKVTLRTQLMEAQGGVCCYCRRPMWETEAQRLELRAKFKLTNKQVARLLLTLEHLNETRGPLYEHLSNKAAACLDCNNTRRNKAWNIHAQQRRKTVSSWFAAHAG